MTQPFNYPSIAKMIDHSLLNPTLTTRELDEGCALALRYNVASVCILPYALARCADLLTGSTVNASTTIGFPHGGHTTAIKLAEARQALKDGGQELDAVINIGKARSEDWQYVSDELAALADTIHAGGAKIKVIFENAYLDDAAKIRLCEICAEIGAEAMTPGAMARCCKATIAAVATLAATAPPATVFHQRPVRVRTGAIFAASASPSMAPFTRAANPRLKGARAAPRTDSPIKA